MVSKPDQHQQFEARMRFWDGGIEGQPSDPDEATGVESTLARGLGVRCPGDNRSAEACGRRAGFAQDAGSGSIARGQCDLESVSESRRGWPRGRRDSFEQLSGQAWESPGGHAGQADRVGPSFIGRPGCIGQCARDSEFAIVLQFGVLPSRGGWRFARREAHRPTRFGQDGAEVIAVVCIAA